MSEGSTDISLKDILETRDHGTKAGALWVSSLFLPLVLGFKDVEGTPACLYILCYFYDNNILNLTDKDICYVLLL